MNCLRCNTPNEEGAKFCKNCGTSMAYRPPVARTTNMVDKQSLIFVLVAFAWNYVSAVIWLVVQKLIVPKFFSVGGTTDWRDAEKIYKSLGWFTDGIAILLLIIFSILIKNNTARIFLIIFTVIRIIMLVAYRVN